MKKRLVAENFKAKRSYGFWKILLMLMTGYLFFSVTPDLGDERGESEFPGRGPLSIDDADEFGGGKLVPATQKFSSKRVALGEFQVNNYTIGNQLSPHLASLPDGGFLVTWESSQQDGSMGGIFAQRFNEFGEKVGLEFQVNTFTDGQQEAGSAASFGDGRFLVTWESGRQSFTPPDGNGVGIFAQLFNSTGGRIGSEFQVNTFTTGDQEGPAIVSLDDNTTVIVWSDRSGEDGDSSGVFGQHIDANGTFIGSEFQVNSYITSDQLFPAIAALVGGGFVIVWISYGQDGDSWGVFGQRFDAACAPVGSEFQVNTYFTSQQTQAAVAGLPDGGFVVSWMSDGQDGDSFGVYAKQYDQTGVPIGPEFRVNAYTVGQQSNPVIAGLSKGGYFIVFQSYGQDGSYQGIYGQRYDAMGVPVGSTPFRVNTFTLYGQYGPCVAGLSREGAVAAWTSDANAQQDGSGAGIFAQLYKPTIVLVNANVTITEGGTVVLGPINFSAQDDYVAQLMLRFLISNLLYTQLLGVTGGIVPNSELIAGQVSMRHDGGENATSFDVAACNGPYCSASRAATVSFTHVDDPPILSTTVTPVLTSILEDTVNPSGDTVSSIIVDGSITDPDDPVVKAMAVTTLDESIGRWEYLLDGGSGWAAMSPVSATNVLLLSGSDSIRLIPCKNCNGQETFMFRAWGMKSGIPGTKVNPGNGTDFSVDSETALITVTSVNDAPVIVNAVVSISRGGRVTFTPDMLSAIDVDSTNASLVFLYSNFQHCQIEYVSSPDTPVGSSLQEDITKQRLGMVDDGSPEKPGFDLQVTDGIASSPVVSVKINFSQTTDNSINDRIIAALVGGGISLIFLGLKIYLRFRAERHLEKHAASKDGVQAERAEFRKNVLKPIAKAIAEEVKITGFLGYIGERTMRDFVSAVVELISQLSVLGVDLDLAKMEDINREYLLKEIARRTRYELGLSEKSCGMVVRFFKSEATPHQIEEHAEQIAQAVDRKMQSRNPPSALVSSGFLAPPSPTPQDQPEVVELSDVQVMELANELMDHSGSGSSDNLDVISV